MSKWYHKQPGKSILCGFLADCGTLDTIILGDCNHRRNAEVVILCHSGFSDEIKKHARSYWMIDAVKNSSPNTNPRSQWFARRKVDLVAKGASHFISYNVIAGFNAFINRIARVASGRDAVLIPRPSSIASDFFHLSSSSTQRL